METFYKIDKNRLKELYDCYKQHEEAAKRNGLHDAMLIARGSQAAIRDVLEGREPERCVFMCSCFIRKNTPELRKKLLDLGYEVPFDHNNGCIATTATPVDSASCISESKFDSSDPHRTWNTAERIDCGTNEELFLALAALRYDNDEHQWFISDDKWFKCDFKSIEDFKEDARQSNYNGAWVFHNHKATVKEILLKHGYGIGQGESR